MDPSCMDVKESTQDFYTTRDVLPNDNIVSVSERNQWVKAQKLFPAIDNEQKELYKFCWSLK